MNKSQSTGIWIVVVLLILCLGSMLFPGQTTSSKDISYSQFLSKVISGQIESVQIDKDRLFAKWIAGLAESVTTVMNSKKGVPVQYRVMIPMNDLIWYCAVCAVIRYAVVFLSFLVCLFVYVFYFDIS